MIQRNTTTLKWKDFPAHGEVIEAEIARLCRDDRQPVTTTDLAKRLIQKLKLADVRSSLRRVLDKEMETMPQVSHHRKRGY